MESKTEIPLEKRKEKTKIKKEKSNKIKSQQENKDSKDEKENYHEDTTERTQQLTEKQMRKLEWEKKLAGVKHGEKTKDVTSKADLKAKRREQQEFQRQAKSLAKVETVSKPELNNKSDKHMSSKPKQIHKKIDRKDPKVITKLHEVQLVKHLYIKEVFSTSSHSLVVYNDVHSAFMKLGAQYMSKIILGSNARCLALLAALKSLVLDLEAPSKQEFCRYLETVLQICTNYLQKCRPLAVSMTNALKYFKLQLSQIDTSQKDNEKKVKLLEIIDTYINNDIKRAGDAISIKVNKKITNGDVILTYGCSSLIRKILIEAHRDGKQFQVIVVDGRPLMEGKEMLRRLVVSGIHCTYILINSISYLMSKVTKVLLGAHALLTNGYVVSRIGTAQVALSAQAYNKPVLVCCETYKFSEHVQTDSFVYNEIDDPNVVGVLHIADELSPLNNWEKIKMLTPLNLLYDVTPPDLVSAVVTEIAILPCTSVPVVLRINANET